jgi:hypothetical protein
MPDRSTRLMPTCLLKAKLGSFRGKVALPLVFYRVPVPVWIAIVCLGRPFGLPEARHDAGLDESDYIIRNYGTWACFAARDTLNRLCTREIFILTGNPNYGFACEWEK